jgi:hypothetical protein
MAGFVNTGSTRSVWIVAGSLALFAAVMLGMSADVVAQGRGGGAGGRGGGAGGRGGGAAERAAEAEAAAKDPLNFTGYWAMPGYKTPAGHGFEAREACAALKDPSGAVGGQRRRQVWTQGFPQQARTGLDGIS